MIYNFFDFYWVLKGCVHQHNWNFDEVSKMATAGLLKIAVFSKKDHPKIIMLLKLNCRYGPVIKTWQL